MLNHWYTVDAGAYYIRFYDNVKDQKVAIRSVTASQNGKIIASGKKALEQIYNPDIQIRYPINHEHILSTIQPIIKKGLRALRSNRNIVGPSIYMCVPTDMEQEVKDAWTERFLDAGAKNVKFVSIMDVLQTQEPTMIIHAGHSYTEIGIYAQGQQYSQKTIFYGGRQMDENIQQYFEQNYRCFVTLEDACALKEAATAAFLQSKNVTLRVNAFNAERQLGQLQIKAMEIWPCMQSICDQITLWAKDAMEHIDVNMKEAIHANGILLSGGLARCFGVKQSLEYALNCPVLCTATPEYDIIENMKEWV